MHPYPESRTKKSTHEDTVSDGLVNYDIIEQIGEGCTSTVHLATCNRGRLRHRSVAVKKIFGATTLSTPEVAHLASTTSLHQSLHHPNIVSLLSSFSTNTARYHVLELCAGGTLSRFLRSRDTPILSEGEMRGVLKSLVDALMYLRRELVIHRDIKPANILLTHDYRIKVADFGLATRLSTVDSTALTFCGSPNYVSPEIISRLPYSFTTDLWSLGCLVIACLSGNPPFEASGVSEILENVSKAAYTLPETLSSEVKDLISNLLQINPKHRIPLHRILSHPFFNSTFPVVSLESSQQGIAGNGLSPKATALLLNKRHTEPSPSSKLPKKQYFTPKVVNPRNRGRHSDVPRPIDRRKAFGEIGNKDLRRLFNDGISGGDKSPSVAGSTRRIVSDPLPRKPDSLAIGRVALTSRPDTDIASHSSLASPDPSEGFRNETLEGCPKFPLITHPLLSVHKHPEYSERTKKFLPNGTHKPSSVAQPPGLYQPSTFTGECNDDPPNLLDDHTSIGTTRPLRFTTSPLNPQMHKTVHGQVTILPSRSLLVDFREGERRRGKKGNEVLVVDPTGVEVKVHSAPHLSTPCCLAEATAVYPIDRLPSLYWKQYNDAGRVVERLKQRTPKLVLYQAEAKCTLMSNAPNADVELLFHSGTSVCHPKRGDRLRKGAEQTGTMRTQQSNPNMRVRLSRKCASVEIARHVVGHRGSEWTKKVLAITGTGGGDKIIDEMDWSALQLLERKGLESLAAFLRVCEAVEFLADSDRGPDVPLEKRGRSVAGLCLAERPVNIVFAKPSLGVASRLPDSTSVKSLVAHSIVPRPRKLSPRSGELLQAVHWHSLHQHQYQHQVQVQPQEDADSHGPALSTSEEVTRCWRDEIPSANSSSDTIEEQFMPLINRYIPHDCANTHVSGLPGGAARGR